MIRVFLTGGLGNQMFQYAAGKALAEKTSAELHLDLSLLDIRSKNTTFRNFELNKFVLDSNIKITSSKLKGLLLAKIYLNIRNSLSGKKITQYLCIFTDKESCNFDSRFLSLQDNIRLLGFFQSEKYFLEYRDIIKKSFVSRKELSDKNQELAEEIKSANAVSIHIRRGDYITNQNASGNYIPCSKEYYEKSVHYICEKIESPRFFVFSDEPGVTKELLHLENAVYIDWNKEEESYNDMWLMSLCKHNIIANSSFSWWGAWLNNYSGKIVITPRQWFRNEAKNNNVKDLIPQQWIRL